jgi:CheY-like chemotaxis protein/AraC-like DNA-binding protein
MQDKTISILLIDDSTNELRLLSNMLRTENYRVLVATDGLQGYQRAISAQPDLILMDVLMPKMDGFVACRLLKTNPSTRHIPVIFLSAKNTPGERLQGLRIGAADYVSKPFEEEEVLLRMQVHLGKLHNVGTGTGQDTPARPGSNRVLAMVAIELIRNRLDQLPAVSELASLLGTYEKKLQNIFRQEFQMTISSFIKEERMRLARKLLTETEMSIHKIGESVGMNNAANFATAFRERLGVTPSQYREATQNIELTDAPGIERVLS